jgi:glycosyltransferase involved in cell wall biosynthesis
VFVPCVLVPTYDNPRTVAEVVRGALAHCPRVVLVDDGSGPEAARAIDELAALPGVSLVRHERNRGKGKALKSAFQRARALGCTHGLAIDADGQHPLEQVPTFLARAEQRPEALLIGDRDLAAAGAGRGSTWGRKNSNFWTWVETGRWIPDTQSGFRLYPLDATLALGARGERFAFETEVLILAVRAGLPVLSVPVRIYNPPPHLRQSHFRGISDTTRIVLTVIRLLLRVP